MREGNFFSSATLYKLRCEVFVSSSENNVYLIKDLQGKFWVDKSTCWRKHGSVWTESAPPLTKRLSEQNWKVYELYYFAFSLSQDYASSILTPHTGNLKWPAIFCLTGLQSWKGLGTTDVRIAKWTLSGYKTRSRFIFF